MILFEEDYNDEQKALLAEHDEKRKKVKKQADYWFDRKDIIKRAIKWQKEHHEHYKAYNNALQKKRYREGRFKKTPLKQCSKIKMAQTKEVKKRNHLRERVRITKQTMVNLLMDETKRIAANFMEELENGKRKKTLFCIVGESGAGKTLASLHLRYKLNANVICSFTTRPARKEEENGRDHYFVDIVPPKENLLAYTKFGPDSHKYYALKSQVQGPVTVYVVDEKGLVDLQKRWEDEYRIYAIYIKRQHHLIVASGVDKTRANRDNTRRRLPPETYDQIIENNGTKKELFDKIEAIYNQLMEEAKQYGW